MNVPKQLKPQRVAPDTYVLPSWLPVPGAGVLAVNAFVVDGEQPILIDTGLRGLRDGFLDSLSAVVEPAALQWIWITHADQDHIGNLEPVLAAAPQATVVTTFLGLAKLQLAGIEPPRVHLLNPGQGLAAGDRVLHAVAPPTFDAPETCAVFDASTGVLFSADCLGALLDKPAERAAEIDPAALRDGLVGWAAIDAPWLHRIDRERFARSLEPWRALGASTVLSAHLPPAHGLIDRLLELLALAPEAPPFVGPDQAAFEQLLATA